MNLTQILACEGTAIYYTESQALHFHKSGRLQLLLSLDGQVQLHLEDFQHNVNPSVLIQYEKNDPQFEMVFYLKRYPKGQWVIKINEHADEVFSCLNEKSYLREKNKASKYASYSSSQSKKQEEEEKKYMISSKSKNKKPQIKREELVEEEEDQSEDKTTNKNSVTVGSVLVGASKGLGWGLAWTGKMLSKGVQGVGGMISKRVQPAQRVQVSEGAKANIELAKNTTKNVLEFSAKQVGNLFNFGKQVASDIGERFQKSDKGKQMQENPKYGMIKSGTATGVKVLANVYDGAVNAMYEVGSGISKGTSKVLGAKYGQQAGEAVDDIFEGTGNIVKITRIPTDETYKTFKE